MYVGGLRLRLIKDNIHRVIEESLDALNWFDPNGDFRDVTLTTDEIDTDTEIQPNTIALSAEEINYEEMELGSDLSEHRWDFFVDIFGEDEDTAVHIAGDIFDIMRGRFDSIGRDNDRVEILDLTQATPTGIFTVGIEDAAMNKVRNYSRPYNKHWWIVYFAVVDEYDDEYS